MKVFLALLVSISILSGCTFLERAQLKRETDPAAYDVFDPNKHYFSKDQSINYQGS